MKRVLLAFIGCLLMSSPAQAKDKDFKMPCLSSSEVVSKMSPTEIYPSMRSCILEERFDDASFLYGIGWAYSSYDKERIIDTNTYSRASSLSTRALLNIDEETKARFRKVLEKNLNTKRGTIEVCKRIILIGHPTYVPTYMIDRGVPVQKALNQEIDPKQTWMYILNKTLRCPTLTLQTPD